MVEYPEDGKTNIPKDTTPNPMNDISKETKSTGIPASPQQTSQQPAPGQDKQPKDTKAIVREFFIESEFTNRIYQLIILLLSLYCLYLSIKGQIFSPVHGIAGMLLLILLSLFDIYLIKRFKTKYDMLEVTIRLVLAGIFFIFMIVFIVELFKPFDITINKYLLLLAFISAVVVFLINFLLYIKTNKGKIVADIYMFIAILFAIISVIVFYQYQVILSFFLMLIAGASIIASLNNDHLKRDERFPTRMLIILLTGIMFCSIFAYASLIFFKKPLSVIKFGTISDKFINKNLENLSWSGDSWSFAYNLSDKKKKQNKIGIINALSMGITELPAEKSEIRLPKIVDKPMWNNNGTKLIFTASNKEDEYKKIWAINLNLSLVETQNKKSHQGEQKRLRTKEDERLNKPVGRPKVLLSDINLIVDMNCLPITHKTAWSPNGINFVFAAKDKDSVNHNIWIGDTRKQELVKITSGNDKIMPLWSPADEKILYVTKTDSYTYLKVTNYDGSNPRELDIRNKEDRSLFPLWNANESKVIYVKNNKLIIMNANATNQQDLNKTTLPPSDYWLTDAKKKIKLMFTESGVIWRIFTINPEGKQQQEIFSDVCDSMIQPKWSYDGEVICVGTNYINYSTLWRINKDGELKTKLFTSKHKIKIIEWDPSSKRIAFLLEKNIKDNVWYDEAHDKIYQIWVVERDGTNPRFIYESVGIINNITWDNLGRNIAFDETYSKWYFAPKITTVKIANVFDYSVTDLLPYEFYAESPAWSNDGQILAYISWAEFWRPTLSKKIWIAQVK